MSKSKVSAAMALAQVDGCSSLPTADLKSIHKYRPLLFLLLYLPATYTTYATFFPSQDWPSYSATAGLCAYFIATAERGRQLAWFALTVLIILLTRMYLGLPVPASLVVAVAIGSEGLLLRFLLPRFQLDASALSFEYPAVIPRVLIVTTLASVGSALVVVLGSIGLVDSLQLLQIGAIRLGADLTGIMTVAPLMYSVPELLRLSGRARLELALSVLAVAAALYLGFTGGASYYFHPYLPIAVLLFAVVRCGRHAAALALALWAPLSITYTQRGLGPWVGGAAVDVAIGVQLYNLTAFASAWLVVGLVGERLIAHAALEQSHQLLERRVAARTAEMAATIKMLQAETDARQQAEQGFRELFNQAASCMLLIEPMSGRIVDANGAAATFYGWSPAELRQMSIRDINELDDAALERELSSARSLARNHFNFRHRRACGDVRDVEVYSSPITFGGRPLLYSNVHDITDAREAERALLESERRYREAFDCAPLGMVEVSLDGSEPFRYLRVNQAFRALVGRSEAELHETRPQHLTHPEDRADEAELGAKLMDGTLDAFQREVRLHHKSGEPVWVAMNATVLRDRYARRYLLIHVEDITARKHAAELVDLVFETCVDPLSTVSFEGRFLHVNRAWEQTLGWSAEQLRNLDLLTLVHSEDRAQTSEMMRALAEGQPVLGFENRYRCKDGSYRWFQWNSAPLPARRFIVTCARDVTARKHAEADLAKRALYDGLTGLPNRHLLQDRLTQELRKLERHPGVLGVCYVDLDNFKEINDSLGHEAGDRALVEVARRLNATVRTGDTVARLAGDEFVVLCPSDNVHETFTGLVGRIARALHAPFEDEGHALELGASIGLSSTHSHATSAEQLLREADTAMYAVKRRGRAGWEAYSPELQHYTQQRRATQQLLREALELEQLRLYYQPVVELGDGHIVGVEALLRLEHPDRGLLLPSEFIDVAEESDLILTIGEWVLKHACRQAAKWNEQFGPLDMAVNVSGRQASCCTIATQVARELQAAALDPARLCLEMTERVLIDSGNAIIQELCKLTRLGVHLALDDFGTGYSSLTYLKRFPIDTVKIDRSFIADLGVGQHDTAIVRAITGLALNMHLATVAEGVESPEQVHGLLDLHCQRAQGFLFSQPVPADHITRLLENKQDYRALAS